MSRKSRQKARYRKRQKQMLARKVAKRMLGCNDKTTLEIWDEFDKVVFETCNEYMKGIIGETKCKNYVTNTDQKHLKM